MTWLDDSRRDLVAGAFNAPQERPWVPGSRGLLAEGKRHLIAAEAKAGKSLAMLTHALDVVAAGGSVAILDRENGYAESCLRLRDLLASRGEHGGASPVLAALGSRLVYCEWPTPAPDAQLVEALRGFDLVVLDSSRAFLSLLGLDENVSDDVARFMAGIMDPLHRAGVATLVLDNSGHDEKRRPRGSSSKLDLFDVVYVLRTAEPFSRTRRGRVVLARERSRLAEIGDSWTMVLGGGEYSSWQTPEGAKRDELASRVLTFVIEHAPVSTVNVRAGVMGKAATVSAALEVLADEGEIVRGEDGWRPCPAGGDRAGQAPQFVDRPNPEATPVPGGGLGAKPPPDGTGSPDGGNGNGNLSLSRDREREDGGSEMTSSFHGSSTPARKRTIDEVIAALAKRATPADDSVDIVETVEPPRLLDDLTEDEWLAAFPGSTFDEGVA